MKAKMQAAKAKRKAKKAERKYDESQAYNKNLSPEARLHYIENYEADKDGASMYGKGPNAFGAAEVIAIASTLAPFVKPTLSGIESLGAGKKFSEGFKMNNKKSIKKEAAKFAKTDVGKDLKQKGVTALDKLIKESGKALKGAKMTGKEKGPHLLGMGQKETKGAGIGAGLGMLAFGPLGAVAGGFAGKAFGKGRDRKEAEEGAGANMMGNSISKHMGGRGANMYGEGPNAIGGKLLGGTAGKIGGATAGGAAGAGVGAAVGRTLGTLAAPVTFGLSIPAGTALGAAAGGAAGAGIGGAAGAAAGAGGGHVRDKIKEKKRNKRRAAKAGGANMEGKKPMMKGGENVIVRDAKSGGKNQYNKRGK